MHTAFLIVFLFVAVAVLHYLFMNMHIEWLFFFFCCWRVFVFDFGQRKTKLFCGSRNKEKYSVAYTIQNGVTGHTCFNCYGFKCFRFQDYSSVSDSVF